MKALILAAGRGRRLWPYTADRPKCLLYLETGTTILDRQLGQLEQVGVRQVVIVCGFGVDLVRRQARAYDGNLTVKCAYNPFYATSDNLISLWTARSEMDDDLLLLNGDGVFHPAMIELLAEAGGDICLMVSRKRRYDEDDMRVAIRRGAVARVCKSLAAADTDAESVGAMRFSLEGLAHLRRSLEEIVVEPRALNGFFLEVVQRLADDGYPIRCLDATGLPWADVDTPEDLRQVRATIDTYGDPRRAYGRVNGGA